MEIGGTSCDVTLLSKGGAEIASEFDLGGYHVALPSVDIHSIGAGGGTIAARRRCRHAVRRSARCRRRPRPASYGRGGTDATVTDAQLVLGRLEAGPPRRRPLARPRPCARAAIEQRIAQPLGLSVTKPPPASLHAGRAAPFPSRAEDQRRTRPRPAALRAGRGRRRGAHAWLVDRPQARLARRLRPAAGWRLLRAWHARCPDQARVFPRRPRQARAA